MDSIVSNHSVTFIMVEDNFGHVRLFEKLLRREGLLNQLHHFEDARKAIESLSFEPVSSPTVLILDLNLPLIHGTDVIRNIRSIYSSDTLPIIVVSTSMDQREMELCNALGSQSELRKPIQADGLLGALEQLGADYTIESCSEGRRLVKRG